MVEQKLSCESGPTRTAFFEQRERKEALKLDPCVYLRRRRGKGSASRIVCKRGKDLGSSSVYALFFFRPAAAAARYPAAKAAKEAAVAERQMPEQVETVAFPLQAPVEKAAAVQGAKQKIAQQVFVVALQAAVLSVQATTTVAAILRAAERMA